MILLDASYINIGGGKSLLNYFITTLKNKNILDNYIFIFDKRLGELNFNIEIKDDKKYFIESNEFNRFLIYNKIIKQQNIQSIFCFNNLPPILTKINIKIFILFHNNILLKKISYKNIFRDYKILLKKYYIRLLNNHSYTWIVQTNLVKIKLVENISNFRNSILILPFYEDIETNYKKNPLQLESCFVYIADASFHKNHLFLLDAWLKIYENYNLKPSLFFTFNSNQNVALQNKIIELNKQGLNLFNLGILNKIELLELYEKCSFLIYPSLEESFGLPLIEASQLNKFIIAIDLPYVKEIIEPTLLFSPYNILDLVEKIFQIVTNKNLTYMPSKLKINNNINNIINLLTTKNHNYVQR